MRFNDISKWIEEDQCGQRGPDNEVQRDEGDEGRNRSSLNKGGQLFQIRHARNLVSIS
jgi:hypothetical protein